jgi:hypothetical protein
VIAMTISPTVFQYLPSASPSHRQNRSILTSASPELELARS